MIIDVTGASSYHGFLPVLVRSCIQSLIDGNNELFPLPFATALFSFLYHLASYESGNYFCMFKYILIYKKKFQRRNFPFFSSFRRRSVSSMWYDGIIT